MSTQSKKYQKAIEYLHGIGMKVQYRFINELKGKWNPAKRPSFLWDFVEYRINPSELKHEVKFAKTILRARKWKRK